MRGGLDGLPLRPRPVQDRAGDAGNAGTAVSLTQSAAEAAPAEQPQSTRSGRGLPWLIASGYLLAALVLTWRLWVDPAGRAQVGDPHDVDLFAWFLRYAATAVSHGHLPALVTTSMNPPQGVNLMWNTSVLLPGILLTPVTLLAGPQVSLTVLLTLGLAGSAAAMYWVLRRWGAGLGAAALGGAVYGFSPALVNSGIGHYHLVLAVLPPLIIDRVLRIVTGRGAPVRDGAWLGLLVAAQVFVSEEMLVDTVLAALLLVVVAALGRRRSVPGRVGGAVAGLATGAFVSLVLSGYALSVQFRGPLREHSVMQGPWNGIPAFIVDPPGTVLFHTAGGAAAAAGFNLGLPEVLGYLGWPLLVVLLAAAIRFWRDARVRAAAVTWVVLELFSLGGGGEHFLPDYLMPWHWIQGLPVMAQVLPDRLAILADGAAAAVLAFSLDLALARAAGSGVPPAGAGVPAGARVPAGAGVPVGSGAPAWRRRLPVAVAVLAVLPLIPLPYQTAPVTPVPAGWQAAFARLRLGPDARVLVVPIGNVGHTQAMRWQAATGEPGSMIGGYFVGPGPNGQSSFDPSPTRAESKYVDWLWGGRRHANTSSAARIRPALKHWRPAAVVAVTGPGSAIARVLTALFGRPSFRIGQVLAWRLSRPS